MAAAEGSGEGVVEEEGGGESGGDDVERVRLLVGGVCVNAEVAESDEQVAFGVEVGEREDVIVIDRRLDGADDGCFVVVELHFRLLMTAEVVARDFIV